MSSSSVVSSKGQIVIPAKLRKKYRLDEGVTVIFQEDQGKLTLEPESFAALYALQGSLKEFPLEETLNQERETARLREER
ncbi:AbrB family looped-hinge helix DNA binding protein [Silvibacterium bohemicum]|uniref:AbrB family looped-hinge helix DNA binding protein n=1 Tax=Silvibacterium bohemicum TaxID=1577686 RepID=A0A841JLX6_9BACT|nr:AbrB/MazE/SpoVT family DNA-binding domain-containing protein [Silvibacterium bohemicum]MBB6142223.1 AbrB family looped-hinge helix DNA binding protein [Silvibacterium bohemicum]